MENNENCRYQGDSTWALTLSSSCPKSTSSNDDLDTLSRASLGHAVNQSMVQQLTRDGNIRHRALKLLPTGLIHSTMCKLLLESELETFRCLSLRPHSKCMQATNLTRLMKNSKMPSLSPSAMPASLAAGLHPMITFSSSSASNRLGTSPEFRMLLMSSRNSSTTIYTWRRTWGRWWKKMWSERWNLKIE